MLQAFTLDNRSIEALLLKGSALLELKKITEAIMHFREALRINSYRYEAHKGNINVIYTWIQIITVHYISGLKAIVCKIMFMKSMKVNFYYLAAYYY